MLTKITIQEIQEVLLQLKFNRFNVSEIEVAEANINTALKMVEKEGNVAQPELKQIYKQLSIWFLYRERHKEQSLTYLKLYISLFAENEESLEQAQAYNLLGHAYTIDGSSIDEHKPLFDKASDTCHKLLEIETHLETIKQLNLEMAFAKRYIGLFHHRKSNPKDAQAYFTEAAQEYEKYRNNLPDINLAECWHLVGVSLLQEKKYEEALIQLEQAYKMETEYCQLKGRKDFMLFVTMQSIGETKRQVAEKLITGTQTDQRKAKKLLEEGENLLRECLRGQLDFFGTKDNADVAKTLQYLGDNLLSQHKYFEATDVYLQTLKVKLAVYQSNNHKLVKFTQDAITETLKRLIKNFHKDDAEKSIQNQIIAANIKKIFLQLSNVGKSSQEQLANFYCSYADYLLKQGLEPKALESLKKASVSSILANGAEASLSQTIATQILALEKQITENLHIKFNFWRDPNNDTLKGLFEEKEAPTETPQFQ